MPVMNPMLIAFAIFSAALPKVLNAEDPREFIVRFGFENATKVQKETNLRIDEESTRLSKLLAIAEKRSKIDSRLGLNGQKSQLIDASGKGDETGEGAVVSLDTAQLVFARPNDRKEYIATTKKKLVELESQRDVLPKWWIPDFELSGSRMNQAGLLRFDFLRVIQNLGDGSFLGKFEFDGFDGDIPVMLIVGMPGAKEFSDDHKINSDLRPLLVICNRTHQYTTASNSTRTVHVLEICDLKSLLTYVETHVSKEDREPRVKSSQKQQQERVWSDISGKFAVRAKLKSVEDGKVTLLKADGKETVVPIDRLSKASREWLETQKDVQSEEKQGP